MRSPKDCKALLTEFAVMDPEGTRAHIRRMLYEQAGDVTITARRLGVKRLTLHRVMIRLGMRNEAVRYRARGNARFRLPVNGDTVRHNEDM